MKIIENGTVLIYEGHDVPKSIKVPSPKMVDQTATLPSSKLTENGKFLKAAEDYKSGFQPPAIIRAYEKIKPGIWSFNGEFELIDAWKEKVGGRSVFKFKLIAAKEKFIEQPGRRLHQAKEQRTRIIPSHIKLAAWKRDKGQCAICGATDELHFDHIVPFSKGGTSLKAENIQLLCARHNLMKSDKIE